MHSRTASARSTATALSATASLRQGRKRDPAVEDVIIAPRDLVEQGAINPDDRLKDGPADPVDQRSKRVGLGVVLVGTLPFKGQKCTDAIAGLPCLGELARFHAETRQVFLGQVNPPVAGIFTNVADDVRQLQGDPARLGQPFGFSPFRPIAPDMQAARPTTDATW